MGPPTPANANHRAALPPFCLDGADSVSVGIISSSSLYSKLRTSPLDTGLEQVYTCSMRLLNMPGKAYFFHPARPIKKARTSLAPFLSGSDHERVALRAPHSKVTRAHNPSLPSGPGRFAPAHDRQ